MPRVKIPLPKEFQFSCELPVMIGEINYGGHLGNDSVLRLVHECRVRFLKSLGFSETNVGERAGLIMSDAILSFKNESFHGDLLNIHLSPANPSPVGFDLLYLLERPKDKKEIARCQTGMICFYYENRKVLPLPLRFKEKLQFKEAE